MAITACPDLRKVHDNLLSLAHKAGQMILAANLNGFSSDTKKNSMTRSWTQLSRYRQLMMSKLPIPWRRQIVLSKHWSTLNYALHSQSASEYITTNTPILPPTILGHYAFQ
jgi:hypothetical protein